MTLTTDFHCHTLLNTRRALASSSTMVMAYLAPLLALPRPVLIPFMASSVDTSSARSMANQSHTLRV